MIKLEQKGTNPAFINRSWSISVHRLHPFWFRIDPVDPVLYSQIVGNSNGLFARWKQIVTV